MADKLELAQWAKNIALKKGASDVKISISNQRRVNVEYRDGKIDKLQESTKNTLNIEIYTEQKFSTHTTNDLRKTELETFIEEAITATKYLSADEYRKLPDPKYYPKTFPDLALMDTNYQKISTEQRIKMVQEIEQSAKEVSDKIISVSSYYSDNYYDAVQINSKGFEGKTEGSFFSIRGHVTVNDPNGGRPSDGDYALYRKFNKLPNCSEIGKNSSLLALKKIGQTKIESGKYDMIVENQAANTVINMILSAITGSSIHQKRSFLDGKTGQKLFSEKLSITDNPFVNEGIGTRAFDDEGIEAKKLNLIENGILNNFYIDTYYGRKLKQEPTTGSISNLTFATGNNNLNEMVKNTKKGILVDSFNGGNSNSTTGDFSFGISGQLIENGIIIKPVNEMIISGNALDFWKTLQETGNDANQFSSVMSPSLLFKDVDFSGK